MSLSFNTFPLMVAPSEAATRQVASSHPWAQSPGFVREREALVVLSLGRSRTDKQFRLLREHHDGSRPGKHTLSRVGCLVFHTADRMDRGVPRGERGLDQAETGFRARFP